MANVSFIRPELKNKLDIYREVEDCCDGSFAVKQGTTKYLPQPAAWDASTENLQRYADYVKRAVFYNVTKNTLSGMTGQIFAKEAQIELPPELENLLDNCDGSGNGLVQCANAGVETLMKQARFGLMADYPSEKAELSQGEIIDQRIQPIIKLYKSSNIVNWRKHYEGSEVVYDLIVLKEKYTEIIDEFESKEMIQYRVLKLNENKIYQSDLYTSSNLDSPGAFVKTKSNIPTQFDGKPFDRIPFHFSGAERNTDEPGVPTLYDITQVNIGHYHNSADYEESCFSTGQPTIFIPGLDQEWVDNVLKGQVQLGSRGGVPLPVGATALILSSPPNSQPFEAMQHKESQFIALGAKLVSPDGTSKTATEANINNTTETSILATLANNTSACFLAAIKSCQKFVNSTSEPIFKLNTDFEIAKLPVPERDQLLKEWTGGAISKTEYRNNLRKGKVDLLEDAVAEAEIDQETEKEYKEMQDDPSFVDPKLAMAMKAKSSPVGK